MYTVHVEGKAPVNAFTINEAIATASSAVYASTNAVIRAEDDLKAGRIAEWSYGFSAVRIYPG